MSLRLLQLTLIGVAVAAIVVMAGLLPPAARIACLVVVVLGAWATEPARHRRGGWWSLVAVGALLATAGFAIAELSEPAETGAGIAAIAGGALAIIGATIGFPVGSD